MNEEILDLDALVPEPKKVRFGGEIITVNPPKMGELMAMVKFAKKMEGDNTGTLDYEPIVEEMKAILVRVIPELEGKDLSIGQILALETLLSQMATPQQVSEANAEPTEEKKT